ncbi:MAG: helix-turn-helix domain-containing protein [Pseudomonadota bacterium]
MHDTELLNVTWRSAVLMAILFGIASVAMTHIGRAIEQQASQLLGVFLLVFAWNLVPQVLGFSGFYRVYPDLTFAPFNTELWLGPLLLHFTLVLLKQPRPKWHNTLYLPAVVQTLYYCAAFTLIPDYQQKWAYNDAFHIVYIRPLEVGLTIALTAWCLQMSWRSISAYRVELSEVQSNVEDFDSRWLTRFIVAMLIMFVTWTGMELVHQFNELSYVSQYPFYLLLSLIVLWMGLQALSSIRYPFPVPLKQEASLPKENQATLKNLANDIEAQVWSRQWFLQPRFSITDMARELATNESYISRAINQHLETNFNGLINAARVQHCQQLLRENPQRSLVELVFESGFNSKASFNRNFKEYTGQSPSVFVASLSPE